MGLVEVEFDDGRIEGQGQVAAANGIPMFVRRRDGEAQLSERAPVMLVRLTEGTLFMAGSMRELEAGDYVITKFGLAKLIEP